MNYSTIHKIGLILIAILLSIPLLAMLYVTFWISKEEQQVAGLGVMLLIYYVFPFLLASSVAMLFARLVHKEHEDGVAKVWLYISIGSSVIGISSIVLRLF
jgi:hypothetical protein